MSDEKKTEEARKLPIGTLRTFTKLDADDREALKQATKIEIDATGERRKGKTTTLRAIKQLSTSKDSPFEGGGDLHREITLSVSSVPCRDCFVDGIVTVTGTQGNELLATAIKYVKAGDGISLVLSDGVLVLRVCKAESRILSFGLCKL